MEKEERLKLGVSSQETETFGEFGGYGGLQTEPSSPIKNRSSIPGKTACSFEIERTGITYSIDIVDNTDKNKRFNIVVCRVDDPTDRDYLSIAHITMFYDELQGYLTKNLKIYLNDKNRISYLALTDNENVFAAKSKTRNRGKTLPKNLRASTETDRFETEPVFSIQKMITQT